MFSVQYRDTVKKIPTQYKNLGNELQQKCPGQCTCNFGTRSNYDSMQFNHYVRGKPERLHITEKISGWKM
jgi:hypothetical protein